MADWQFAVINYSSASWKKLPNCQLAVSRQKSFAVFFSGGFGGFGGLAEQAVCNYLIVSWLHANRQLRQFRQWHFQKQPSQPEEAAMEDVYILYFKSK